MTILVSEITTTSWTLTANQICEDALGHIGALGAGDSIRSEDQNRALRALNAVLKELPLAGFTWPKLSEQVAIAWVPGSPSEVPDDYYGYPCVFKTVNGKKVPLVELTHAQWLALDQSATGEPSHFYLTPANQVTFWPVPSADPVAVLQYQRLIDDANLSVSPDLPGYWVNALGYGVADEISLTYGLDQPTRMEIANRWAMKREAALQNSISSAPICFTVAD